MSDLPLDQFVQGHHWDPLAILGVHPMAQGSPPIQSALIHKLLRKVRTNLQSLEAAEVRRDARLTNRHYA